MITSPARVRRGYPIPDLVRPDSCRSARTNRGEAGLTVTGHPRNGAPGTEHAGTACRHQADKADSMGRSMQRIRWWGGIVGASGLVPWRGKGRSGTEGRGVRP